MAKGRGCGGCLLRLILGLFVLAVLAGGGLAFVLLRPYRGFTNDVVIDIPKGTGTSAIGKELAGAGVVQYPWQFLVLRALRPGATLKAGEYQFTKPASAWTVFDRMIRGDVFYYELTVPEGQNMFDIAKSVDQL